MEGGSGFVGPLKTLGFETPRMTFIFGAGIPVAGALRADVDERFQRAWDTLHDADVGDFVIFNTDRRKAALEVTDVVPGDPRTIEVTGAGGGVFEIAGKTNAAGTPAFSTNRNEPANDLQFAGDEAIHDYLEQTGEAGQPDELATGEDEENDVPPANADGEPAEIDETPGGSVPKTPFQDVEVDEMEEVLLFRGYHTTREVSVDLEFTRTTDGWELDADVSDFGGVRDFAAQANIAQDAEDVLEERGYEILGLMDAPEGMVLDDADAGHPWPTMEKQHPDATAENIDDHVSELSGDTFLTYEELLRDLNRHRKVEEESFFEREAPYWTFVDELTSFGQEVPKSVNDWELIDYGIVTDAETRKLVWLNNDDDQLVALSAVRGDGGIAWNVYHASNPMEMEDEVIEPELTTDDPFEALGNVVDTLYGDDRNIDVELVEKKNGEITVSTSTDRKTLGTKVARKLGINVDLPPLPGEGGFTLRGTVNDVRQLLNENQESIGKAALLFAEVAVFGIRRAIVKRTGGLDVGPVVDFDEIGVYVHYRYEGDKAEWLQGEEFGGKLTIDPEQFDLKRRSRLYTGLEYETLVQASNALGFNGVELDMKTNSGSSKGTRGVARSNTSGKMKDKFLTDEEKQAIREKGEATAASTLQDLGPEGEEDWIRQRLIEGVVEKYQGSGKDLNMDRTRSYTDQVWTDIDDLVDDNTDGDWTKREVVGGWGNEEFRPFHEEVAHELERQQEQSTSDDPDPGERPGPGGETGHLGSGEQFETPQGPEPPEQDVVEQPEQVDENEGSIFGAEPVEETDLDPGDLDADPSDLDDDTRMELRRRAEDLGLYEGAVQTDEDKAVIRSKLENEFGAGAASTAKELGPEDPNAPMTDEEMEELPGGTELFEQFYGADVSGDPREEEFMSDMYGPEEQDEFDL